MVDAPTLYPEVQTVRSPVGRGLHGYYRKPNGWIVVASTTSSNRQDYEYKGFTFLSRYGQFKNDGDAGGQTLKAVDAKGQPWNPISEQWRLLFQQGGAKEFAVDQIIAYHWHLSPPYREIVFPQLTSITVTDYFCPECDRGIFSAVNPMEAAQALRIHLTSGVSDSHHYTAEDLRKLGQEEGIDFFSARRVKGSVRRGMAQPKEGAEAIPDLTLNEEANERRRQRRT